MIIFLLLTMYINVLANDLKPYEDEISFIDSISIKDNSLSIKTEIIDPLNKETRKVNPFKLLVEHNKELEVFNFPVFLELETLRDIDESYLENNALNENYIKAFLKNRIFELNLTWLKLNKNITFKDNVLAKDRALLLKNREYLTSSLKFNLKNGNKIFFKVYDFSLNMKHIAQNITKFYEIFNRDFIFIYKGNYKLKNLNNLITFKSIFYKDEIQMHSKDKKESEFKKFVLTKLRHKINLNDYKLANNLALEIGSNNGKGDTRLLLSTLFKLRAFVNFYVKLEFDNLNKSFKDVLKKIDEPNSIMLNNLFKEKNLSLVLAKKVKLQKKFILYNSLSLYWTKDKLSYKSYNNEGDKLDFFNEPEPIKWLKLNTKGKLQFNPITFSFNYVFNSYDILAKPSHKLNKKLKIDINKQLKFYLLADYKSKFKIDEFRKLEGYYVLNFKIKYETLNFFTLSLEINNLFNNESYTKMGFPIERRKIILEFKSIM